MNCPWCGFRFRLLAANAENVPDVAPLICESCGAISLLVNRVPRKPTPQELDAIKLSPAWREVLEPVSRLIAEKNVAPVDRSKTTLTDGSPVTPDHREIDPSTGMQKGYVVLSKEERLKGFVRPLRKTYVHVGARPRFKTRPLTDEETRRYGGCEYVAFEPYPESERPATGRFWTKAQLESGCGQTTSMSTPLAETYARDPKFYGGTFCATCRAHFPLDQFVWEGTNERVGS